MLVLTKTMSLFRYCCTYVNAVRIKLKLQSIVSLCGFSVSELRNAYQISLTSLFFPILCKMI